MNARELQLGLLLLKENLLTRDQLKKALIKQGEIRRFGRHQRLGDVIVKLGLLTQQAIDEAATMQETLAVPAADHTPLGLLLIDRGLLPPSKVYDTLLEQQLSEGRLGEILVQMGMVTEAQLAPLLAQQEQERAEARAKRAADLTAAGHGGRSDFQILDAGGGDAAMSIEATGHVPASPDRAVNLGGSYLDD
jgi:hypothetical protein